MKTNHFNRDIKDKLSEGKELLEMPANKNYFYLSTTQMKMAYLFRK